jgi:hypothetical protein
VAVRSNRSTEKSRWESRGVLNAHYGRQADLDEATRIRKEIHPDIDPDIERAGKSIANPLSGNCYQI